MRDGEQRHSFDGTGSSEMFCTTPETQTPTRQGHLWQSASASEDDTPGSNEKPPAPFMTVSDDTSNIPVKPPASFMSASCEESFDPEPASPTMVPSKKARKKIAALRVASREGSKDKDALPPPLPRPATGVAEDSGAKDSGAGVLAPSEDLSPKDASSARCYSSQSDDEEVMPRQRPKKLFTHDFAIVRSVSREGWDCIYQQPFQGRDFAEEELGTWTPVNTGQLLGFASQKGGQARVPCQDEYAVLHEEGYQVYVVVDGHGEAGETVARFARQWLVNALQRLVRQRDGRVLANGELTKVLADLYQIMVDQEYTLGSALKKSGCTATVVILTPTRSLRGAWIGDCQCLAGRRHEQKTIRCLTPPHTGPAVNGLPGPLTRAIGSFSQYDFGHEVDEFLEADVDIAGLDFVIIGTAGLWRGLSNARVVEEVSTAGPYFAQYACNRVASTSQDHQMYGMADRKVGPAAVQDATIIVVWVGGNVSDN